MGLQGFQALGYGLCAVCLSLAFVNARCNLQALEALDSALEGQDLQVLGVVASLPQTGPTGVRFRLQVEKASRADTLAAVKVPEWIELSWYDRDAANPIDDRAWDDLKAGDQWQFQVRLKAPHGNLNPQGFDYELWLWEQGVMATGTVRAGKRNAAPRKLSGSWRYAITQARQLVRARIAQSSMGWTLPALQGQATDLSGVIAALVMGDQAAISPAAWDIFRATGVAHLMSISGLHITLFAWLMAKLIGALWRGSARQGQRWCLWVPAPYAAAVGGAALATLYALFSGWGLPAQRTVIMLLVASLMKSAGLQWPQFWVLGVALGVVVLWDPWALLQSGFWLSFMAVAVLMWMDPSTPFERTKMANEGAETVRGAPLEKWHLSVLKRLRQSLLSLLKEQWVLSLALTPLSVLFFGQISGIGFLANLVAIPWVTWVVTPLAMLGVLWSPFWGLAACAMQPLMSLLSWMSQLSWAVWTLPVPPTGMLLMAVVGGCVLLQTWPWPIRAWGLMFMLPSFLWQAPQPAWGEFDLWFVDVGQGNAVLLRTAHHALLYDTGPLYSETTDAGQRVLVPLLSRWGVQLDRLMLSHRDADHTGGAAAVLKSQPQADLLTSIEKTHPLSALRDIQHCQAGQRWVWDGVQFEILHPLESNYLPAATSNSLSCVLRVDASQGANSVLRHDGVAGSALLVGDIEASQEMRLLQRQVLQPVDVLLVPHHGSQTSSTEDFIGALAPKWAVVQAGYRNRYGHPAPRILQRYAAQGVPLVASPACGAAHWQSQLPADMRCERQVHRRYWQHQAGS